MVGQRVAAIGLDSASWDYLSELVGQGELPNLARLLERSLHGRLENTIEYRSELSWTTFVTGRTGPHLKYWSTVRFDPDTYEVLDKGAHGGQPFWASLPCEKPIAFDVPHSVLGDHPGLIQVNTWGAHSGQFPRSSKPAGLLTEIDERFGPHPAFEADYEACWHQPQYVHDLADALVAGAERRVDICQWLMEENPDWDLFVTVMSEPHSVGHHCWHGIDPTHPLHSHPLAHHSADAMRRVHIGVDEAVGRLLDALDPDDVVIVFAVHGMANNTNDLPAQALVPELLYRLEAGRSALANPSRAHGARQDTLWPLPPGYTNRYLSRLYADSLPARVARDLWRYSTPTVHRLRWKLKARLTGRPVRDFPSVSDFHASPEVQGTNEELLMLEAGEQAFQGPRLYQAHWPEMRAFAIPTYSDAHIRLNVVGRERHGIVAPEDYDAVCDEIEAELRSLRDLADGQPVIRDIMRVRADDPMDPEGPSADLVVLFNRPVGGCTHPKVGRLGSYPTLRTGEHDNRGFVLIAAPWIRPDEMHLNSALDVAATVASIVSGRVDEFFDGHSLVDPVSP